MQLFLKKPVLNEKSLFDQTTHSSKTMLIQEKRERELQEQITKETDPVIKESLKKEIFEIEKYCQTVNILLCGGV